MSTKKFYLLIFGCQMNISDAERLATTLKSLGYQETDNEDEADLIGVVACSVRQKAVDRIYGKVRNWQIVKEKRPLITILSGCVLERDRKNLATQFDLFIDIKNLDNLSQDLAKIAPEEKLALPSFFDIKPSYYSSYRAYVPIMTGCNKFCTYCAVPYTRGREISRPSENILTEIKDLLDKGYKEIVLLGQNVNSYGLDKQKTGEQELSFPELLTKIDNLAEHFWIKYLTSHPYDMSDELIEVMLSAKNINPYLHLPVQAGADSMLQKMNRHYSIDSYKKLIYKIKEKMPQLAISTDVIVGFSGETETEFQATKQLLAELKYNMAYMSQYSERSGTVAARLHKDDVPKIIKKQRWEELNTLMGQNSLEFNQKLVGNTYEVLIDEVQETGETYKNIGKLANYVAVHLISDQALKVGEFYQATITQANNWGVIAKLAEGK
jgi:tRNA-2-methylthio-N6-dimethylallyladenosine synthase